jgi:short-subunit dehydrogenase
MRREIAGRTAILTGASGGIGPYIARRLVRERVKVTLAAVNLGEIETLRRELTAGGGEAIAVQTDVRDIASLEALITRGMDAFESIDFLINNAGVNNVLPYQTIELEEINDILRINLNAPMLLSRLLLPQMLMRRTGHIVSIASLAGKIGLPYNEAYSATKSGLIAFTEALRSELKGTGVSASVICPGFVRAGIYETLRQSAGRDVPWAVGTSSPDSVARAVIRTLKRNPPEVIVAPLRTRLFTLAAQLSPSTAERVLRMLGVRHWLRLAAERQHSTRDAPNNSKNVAT